MPAWSGFRIDLGLVWLEMNFGSKSTQANCPSILHEDHKRVDTRSCGLNLGLCKNRAINKRVPARRGLTGSRTHGACKSRAKSPVARSHTVAVCDRPLSAGRAPQEVFRALKICAKPPLPKLSKKYATYATVPSDAPWSVCDRLATAMRLRCATGPAGLDSPTVSVS